MEDTFSLILFRTQRRLVFLVTKLHLGAIVAKLGR